MDELRSGMNQNQNQHSNLCSESNVGDCLSLNMNRNRSLGARRERVDSESVGMSVTTVQAVATVSIPETTRETFQDSNALEGRSTRTRRQVEMQRSGRPVQERLAARTPQSVRALRQSRSSAAVSSMTAIDNWYDFVGD